MGMGEELEHRSGWSHAPLPRRLRGYDVGATDALLDEVSAARRRLESECVDLRRQVVNLEADLDRVRKRVSKALIAASTHARAVHDRAQREAEEILRKARDEADELTDEADRIDLGWDGPGREPPLPVFPALKPDKSLSPARD
jgi:hypothetical protein